MILSVSSLMGQINIPGTGRCPMGTEDPNWVVYGFWEMLQAPDNTVTGEENRIADFGTPCISVNDHPVSFTCFDPDPDDPQDTHGGAQLYYSYEFRIIQSGTYSTNPMYIRGANSVELVKSFSTFDKQLIAFGNGHSDCDPYTLTATLDPGLYEVRIPVHGNLNQIPEVWVMTTAGSGSTCVPEVTMNSANSQTIESGGTVTIAFSTVGNISSNYSWHTNGNPNTDLNTPQSGTGNTLIKTINNLTGSVQTVTFTVTPTSVTGNCSGPPQTITVTINPACTSGCDPIKCTDCIGSFSPEAGRYTLSVWVQQANSATEMTYNGPAIALNFTGGPTPTAGPFTPSGPIIDGWQRIDAEFDVSNLASEIFVRLINTSSKEVYFDDLRIHPLKASMKSFVYDPVSMRLMAELDENNYATFYEYDEEGILVRVKKETERGVRTIKESLNNTRKNP
jgi:hypothetical protein